MGHSHELHIGRAGQYLTLCDLLLRGYQSYETAEGCNYDVIVDIGHRLLKIQVKTTLKMVQNVQRSKPIYFFHLRRAGKDGAKTYAQKDFDGFALVLLDRREVCYLPFTKSVKTVIPLRDKAVEYCTNRPGLYLQDLTWEKFIKNFKS